MPGDLKIILKQIKEENYIVPINVNINDIILEMMHNIGNTDPELRDKLIYSIMYHWIKDDVIKSDKLKELLAMSMDENHLFFRIGETGTDSVFTRSFSVLLVPLIIMKHRQNNFLSERDIRETYAKVADYFIKELDPRGYVMDKGWAHSTAHAADALDDLALCSEIGKVELLHMLEIIRNKVFISSYVYINEEDERLVTAIVSILNRKLISNEDICEWIRGFSDIKKTGAYPEDGNLLVNVKNILRSLYFRIIDLENTGVLIKEIKNVLTKISNFN